MNQPDHKSLAKALADALEQLMNSLDRPPGVPRNAIADAAIDAYRAAVEADK